MGETIFKTASECASKLPGVLQEVYGKYFKSFDEYNEKRNYIDGEINKLEKYSPSAETLRADLNEMVSFLYKRQTLEAISDSLKGKFPAPLRWLARFSKRIQANDNELNIVNSQIDDLNKKWIEKRSQGQGLIVSPFGEVFDVIHDFVIRNKPRSNYYVPYSHKSGDTKIRLEDLADSLMNCYGHEGDYVACVKNKLKSQRDDATEKMDDAKNECQTALFLSHYTFDEMENIFTHLEKRNSEVETPTGDEHLPSSRDVGTIKSKGEIQI